MTKILAIAALMAVLAACAPQEQRPLTQAECIPEYFEMLEAKAETWEIYTGSPNGFMLQDIANHKYACAVAGF